MITFNGVLRESGINPEDVQLVRHKDERADVITTPYSLWLNDKKNFEFYQRLQGKDKFRVGKSIASFVVTPRGKTLFAGLYKILSRGQASPGTKCPVSRKDCASHFLYEIKAAEGLKEYVGILEIEWTGGPRNWVQYATTREKPVVELRKKQEEDEFPGFTYFCIPINEIKRVPKSWSDILLHSQGVYLLTCRRIGKQYVGSAKGAEGFWQRFCNYADTKHGGNVELKSFDTSDMWVSILQVVHIGVEQVERIEQKWKEKLQTNVFGLNRN
jgi:hypothetical protein